MYWFGVVDVTCPFWVVVVFADVRALILAVAPPCASFLGTFQCSFYLVAAECLLAPITHCCLVCRCSWFGSLLLALGRSWVFPWLCFVLGLTPAFHWAWVLFISADSIRGVPELTPNLSKVANFVYFAIFPILTEFGMLG